MAKFLIKYNKKFEESDEEEKEVIYIKGNSLLNSIWSFRPNEVWDFSDGFRLERNRGRV